MFTVSPSVVTLSSKYSLSAFSLHLCPTLYERNVNDRLRFPSHLTKEDREEITNESNTDLSKFKPELELLRIELAEAKANLILRTTELNDLPGPETVGLPPADQ